MNKVGHRIIAVPERAQYVQVLLERTGLTDDIVLWDHEHNGCMWNAIRAWKDALNNQSYTHWCVMADDTDVVDDYIELEKMCVNRFPDAIFTFYSNELSRKHRPLNTPYVKLTGYNVRGIAFLMPTTLVQGYVSLCEYMLEHYDYQRDDATCRIYALFNDIPVMTTIPNLVRSHEIKSSMKGHGVTHNSDAWSGYSLNKRDFTTLAYEERKILKKSALETHLKPDNPVDIKVRQVWDRMMKLRRI